MGIIIRNGINYSNESFVEVTQAQYDALSEEDKMNGTVYLIDDGLDFGASDIPYKNTTVKDALDSINEALNTRLTKGSLGSVSSASTTLTLPSDGVYLIITRHASTPNANTMWLKGTGTIFLMNVGANGTNVGTSSVVAVSAVTATTITMNTTNGSTVTVYYLKVV